MEGTIKRFMVTKDFKIYIVNNAIRLEGSKRIEEKKFFFQIILIINTINDQF